MKEMIDYGKEFDELASRYKFLEKLIISPSILDFIDIFGIRRKFYNNELEKIRCLPQELKHQIYIASAISNKEQAQDIYNYCRLKYI